MPKKIATVWLWEDGLQIVYMDAVGEGYVYLSRKWPFVTHFPSKRAQRQPEAGA